MKPIRSPRRVGFAGRALVHGSTPVPRHCALRQQSAEHVARKIVKFPR